MCVCKPPPFIPLFSEPISIVVSVPVDPDPIPGTLISLKTMHTHSLRSRGNFKKPVYLLSTYMGINSNTKFHCVDLLCLNLVCKLHRLAKALVL